MKARLEQPTQYLRRLEIDLPASEVDAAFGRVITELKQRAHVPGFRPGKMPTSVIVQRFRKSIDSEVLAILISQELIGRLLSEHQLNPVSQFHVDPGTLVQGADFSFVLELEVLPEVELKGLDELEVAVKPVVLKDEEVDAKLESMRQGDAQYRPVEGRTTVVRGDELTFDYVVSVDGKLIEERNGAKTRTGDERRFPDEVEEALLAASLDVEQPVAFTFPETHQNKEFAGKTADFRVTVKEIREKLIPELDDEWARDHDKDSLVELRASVVADLEKEKAELREQAAEQAILDKLIETHPFEIPPGLARAEVDKRMQNLVKMFGGSPELLGGEMFDTFRRTTRDRTHADLRKAILVRSVVTSQNIVVSDSDIEERIANLAQQGPDSAAKVRARYAAPDAREALRADMQEERALAFLRSTVRIVEAAAEG